MKLTKNEPQEAQMQTISEQLDEADGFKDTSEDTRFHTCQRALRQVLYTLDRLASVWKVGIISSHHGSLLRHVVDYAHEQQIFQNYGRSCRLRFCQSFGRN